MPSKCPQNAPFPQNDLFFKDAPAKMTTWFFRAKYWFSGKLPLFASFQVGQKSNLTFIGRVSWVYGILMQFHASIAPMLVPHRVLHPHWHPCIREQASVYLCILQPPYVAIMDKCIELEELSQFLSVASKFYPILYCLERLPKF